MSNGQDLHSFRINRNIVECKVEVHKHRRRLAGRINRNIVECKVIQVPEEIPEAVVLIETLWNVK